MIYQCQKCGLSKSDGAMGSVLPQCHCDWAPKIGCVNHDCGSCTAHKQEPVGEVYRYGRDSSGRQWHGIHWYDSAVDMPHGTQLYASLPAQRRPLEGVIDVRPIGLHSLQLIFRSQRDIEKFQAEYGTKGNA